MRSHPSLIDIKKGLRPVLHLCRSCRNFFVSSDTIFKVRCWQNFTYFTRPNASGSRGVQVQMRFSSSSRQDKNVKASCQWRINVRTLIGTSCESNYAISALKGQLADNDVIFWNLALCQEMSPLATFYWYLSFPLAVRTCLNSSDWKVSSLAFKSCPSVNSKYFLFWMPWHELPFLHGIADAISLFPQLLSLLYRLFRRNLLLRQSIRYLHLYRNCFYVATLVAFIRCCTAVSSEAWAKLREWAVLAG